MRNVKLGKALYPLFNHLGYQVQAILIVRRQFHKFIAHIGLCDLVFAQSQFRILRVREGFNARRLGLLHLVDQGHDIIKLTRNFMHRRFINLELGQISKFLNLIRTYSHGYLPFVL